MSTPDDLETLLRRHDEAIKELKRRKSIVPSRNPQMDSLEVLGDVEILGELRYQNSLLEDLLRLNRSYRGTVSAVDFPGVMVSGGVSTYPSRTPGTLPIVLDETGETIYASPVAASGFVGLQLWPSDRVEVRRGTDGSWVCEKVMPKRYLIEGFAGSVYDHYDNTYVEGSVYLGDDGWATWQGLNINASAITTSTVLFTLPPELLPKWLAGQPATKRTRFNAFWGDQPAWFDIYADGTVKGYIAYSARQTYTGWTGPMYPTASAADVIRYPGAQGSSTTDPCWANGFTDYVGSSGADPSFMPYCYVIDSYGVMHNWGMVRNPASFPATNNPIIALGSNQQGEFQNHYPVYDSSLGFSYVGSDGGQAGHSANGINWKAAGTANGWMCLSNVRVVLAGNTIPWVDTRGGNGWTRYTSGGATLFSPIQFGSYHQARILRGLMGGGTVNAYYSPLPRGYRPVFNMWDSVPSSTNGLLFATVAAAAKGRADIKNYGQAFVQSGSNTWFAVDGLTYVAEG